MTTPARERFPLADLRPTGLDQRAVVTLRMLAADMVQAAGSGHPGMPMGAAAPAYVLWNRFLRHDPTCPNWPDRDRFVLSAGHGSALLYALLHLFGYDLSLDDLTGFRQWGSRTPGHPEYGVTVGVETSTGPLGQGLGNAVGMAIAERMLAARFNLDGAPPLVDHRTFVLASDGDLMEGISHEAASLAGHLRLGRLTVLYDDNRVTIHGSTALTCSDDACARFAAYGWQVQRVADGNDLEAVERALRTAMDDERPSLIAVRTHIGFGAPSKQDSSAAHGAPLGEEELARTKERYDWPIEEPFHVPADVRAHVSALVERGRAERRRWERSLATLPPELGEEWRRAWSGRLPPGLDVALPMFAEGTAVATRKASGESLRALARIVPELTGGSADLASSTCVDLGGEAVTAGDFVGRTLHFGVREHAMGAILNGIALHRGLRPFGSTFLVFSDYMKPAIRLAALMRLPVIYVFTHDSIAVGEDGPTHQPVEQLAGLRATPGLAVLRPADANETVQAWDFALRRSDGPTALVLSRQALPVLQPPPDGAIAKHGAWIVREAGPCPEVVLVATGSEVSLALEAADALERDGVLARVVSVPWRERLISLEPAQLARLLPPDVPRVVIEAGSPHCWRALAGPVGAVIGLCRFGASAPGQVVMQRLGFTADAIREAAHDAIVAAAHGW